MDDEGVARSRRDFMGWGVGASTAALAAIAAGESTWAGVHGGGFDPGYRSVREFGAKGDGRTDDTAAFTAALSTGAPVFVPAGVYSITRPLPALRQRAAIQGVGNRSRVVYRGSEFVFRTAHRAEYVQIDGLTIHLTAPNAGAICLCNAHYARVSNLWIFGSDRTREHGQVGIMIDSARPGGGYWTQGANILMRRLGEGFRLVNRANASTWQNVTIRQTALPVNVASGYGFQLIGGFIESWGERGPGVKPAIHAGGDSGVVLGVVFEERKPRSYVIEFEENTRGWVVLGRFNVLGGGSHGPADTHLLINTANHRRDHLLLRRGGDERPSEPDTWDVFFDASLGKPIWWTGSVWVDALGDEV